jgi:hypothetical protein
MKKITIISCIVLVIFFVFIFWFESVKTEFNINTNGIQIDSKLVMRAVESASGYHEVTEINDLFQVKSKKINLVEMYNGAIHRDGNQEVTEVIYVKLFYGADRARNILYTYDLSGENTGKVRRLYRDSHEMNPRANQ